MVTLFSIGWSDVPEHIEKLKGFLFDMEQMGRDKDRNSSRWEHFGGEGG